MTKKTLAEFIFDESVETISAEQFVEDLMSGNSSYDDPVQVIGDINLTYRSFDHEVTIDGVWFHGHVNFSHSIFNGNLNILNSRFQYCLNVSQATIDGFFNLTNLYFEMIALEPAILGVRLLVRDSSFMKFVVVTSKDHQVREDWLNASVNLVSSHFKTGLIIENSVLGHNVDYTYPSDPCIALLLSNAIIDGFLMITSNYEIDEHLTQSGNLSSRFNNNRQAELEKMIAYLRNNGPMPNSQYFASRDAFYGSVQMSGARIEGKLIIDGANNDEKLVGFNIMRFGEIDFSTTRVNGWVSIRNVQFKNRLELRNIEAKTLDLVHVYGFRVTKSEPSAILSISDASISNRMAAVQLFGIAEISAYHFKAKHAHLVGLFFVRKIDFEHCSLQSGLKLLLSDFKFSRFSKTEKSIESLLTQNSDDQDVIARDIWSSGFGETPSDKLEPTSFRLKNANIGSIEFSPENLTGEGYVEILDVFFRDENKRCEDRQLYRNTSNMLRSHGKKLAADLLYIKEKRRTAKDERRDLMASAKKRPFWRPSKYLAYFQWLRIYLLDTFHGKFLGYGIHVDRLWPIIIALAICSGMIASDPRNINISPESKMIEAARSIQTTATLQRTSDLEVNGRSNINKIGTPEAWSGMDAGWIVLRYHVPIVSLSVRSGFVANGSAPLHIGKYQFKWLSSEDWFTFMTVLHWLFWPILLTYLLKSILRENDV